MQGFDDKRLAYLPGLDGLRALAVMAVLLFHAGQRWIPGGFLGVEVFFVISGYLITCGLLENREQTGGVGLKRFWLRRARGLLRARCGPSAGILRPVQRACITRQTPALRACSLSRRWPSSGRHGTSASREAGFTRWRSTARALLV